MKDMIKNINTETVLSLEQEIHYLPGQIVSKTLAQNKFYSLTLFAFAKGEEISTHASHGDAMVMALDGEGTITIDGTKHTVKSNDTIVMPANKPHAVYAAEPFKMLLLVLFPVETE